MSVAPPARRAFAPGAVVIVLLLATAIVPALARSGEIGGAGDRPSPATLGLGVDPDIGPVGGFATVPVLFAPDGVVYDPVADTVWVANGGSDYVTEVNARTEVAGVSVPVGVEPEYLAFDAKDLELYVANIDSRNVTVVNTSTAAVAGSIPLPAVPGPMTVDPSNGDVYVPTQDGQLIVIGPGTPTIVGTVQLGVGYEITAAVPPAVAYDPTGGDVYAIAFTGFNDTCGCADGEIEAIDPSNLSIVAAIPVGENPTNVVVAAPAGALYVANALSGTLSVISPATQTVARTLSGFPGGAWMEYDPALEEVLLGESGTVIAVVSTVTDSLVTTVAVTTGTGPMALDPGFGLLDVVSGGSFFIASTITVISLATDTVTAQAAAGFTGLLPNGLTFDPHTGDLFVTNSGSGNVSVIGPYAVEFAPSGLRPDAPFSVTIDSGPGRNWTLFSQDRPITFLAQNGTYNYTGTLPRFYAAPLARGVLTVRGAPTERTIRYSWSTATDAGLLAGIAGIAAGAWFARRWRGSGLSKLRREYAAMFQDDLARGPRGGTRIGRRPP